MTMMLFLLFILSQYSSEIIAASVDARDITSLDWWESVEFSIDKVDSPIPQATENSVNRIWNRDWSPVACGFGTNLQN